MTTFAGKFAWTGDLPDDDDLDKPQFAGDFGTLWARVATEQVIKAVCDSLQLQKSVSELGAMFPEDVGWYASFKVDGWSCSLFIVWAPDEDAENSFEFHVSLRHAWYHRLIHPAQCRHRLDALGAAIARALASARDVEEVVFYGRPGAPDSKLS